MVDSFWEFFWGFSLRSWSYVFCRVYVGSIVDMDEDECREI